MGMLDRYKKKGGFVQLLILIETSGKQKQEQFLTLIGQESRSWEEAIRKYMFSIDRIMGWDVQFRSEIFSRIQPLTLATVLHGMESNQLESVLSCISISEKRKIVGMVGERNPTLAEKLTCVLKIISDVRGFSSGGILKLDKCDPEMVIPENIEDILAQQGYLTSPDAELVFPEDSGKAAPLNFEAKSEVSGGNSRMSEEVEFLKKKVNQLAAENNALKHEVNIFRNKLEQIKKIA